MSDTKAEQRSHRGPAVPSEPLQQDIEQRLRRLVQKEAAKRFLASQTQISNSGSVESTDGNETGFDEMMEREAEEQRRVDLRNLRVKAEGWEGLDEGGYVNWPEDDGQWEKRLGEERVEREVREEAEEQRRVDLRNLRVKLDRREGLDEGGYIGQWEKRLGEERVEREVREEAERWKEKVKMRTSKVGVQADTDKERKERELRREVENTMVGPARAELAFSSPHDFTEHRTVDGAEALSSRPRDESFLSYSYRTGRERLSLHESAPGSRWPQRLSAQRNCGFAGGVKRGLRRDAVNEMDGRGMRRRRVIPVPVGLQDAMRRANNKKWDEDGEWKEENVEEEEYYSAAEGEDIEDETDEKPESDDSDDEWPASGGIAIPGSGVELGSIEGETMLPDEDEEEDQSSMWSFLRYFKKHD